MRLPLVIFCLICAVSYCGDGKIVIELPGGVESRIYVNGKLLPSENGDSHSRPRYAIEFRYHKKRYFALHSGPYDSSNQAEHVSIYDFDNLKEVASFYTIMYSFDYNGKKVNVYDDDLWDGRTWTPDYNNCVLIENWSKKKIPMTIDAPNGFFIDQMQKPEIVITPSRNGHRYLKMNKKIKK